MEINAAITQRINEEIEDLKIPLTSLSANTGIAYATLRRKVLGTSDWTATEIAGMARALRVAPAALIPALLTGELVAA